MSNINFKYCPICGGELETGKVKFPAPHSIFDVIDAQGQYYSDENLEKYQGHPIKKLFCMEHKEFTIQTWGVNNPAGYCKECNRIFAEFEIGEYL